MENYNILAIIPARGGSKGLPRKNMKLLEGKPLVVHTIEQAKKSKHIDKVVVSTEDEEIAGISRKYGAKIIRRPKELAKDDSTAYHVVMHALRWLEERGDRFDIFLWLEPTSPLRKENDLDSAIELFINNLDKADSLVSVGEVQTESPFLMKTIKNGFVVPFGKVWSGSIMRQDLPKTFFPYGVIYMSKTNSFKKHKTFYQERSIPYFIERWQNYEINDICDFRCVEAIMKHKNGGEE